MSSYEGLCPDCQQVECDEACMKATSTEALRSLYLMAQNHGVYLTEKLVTAEASIEALRAEVAEWKRVAAAQAELHDEAESRAERLASWMINNLLTESQLSVVPPGQQKALRYLAQRPAPVGAEWTDEYVLSNYSPVE